MSGKVTTLGFQIQMARRITPGHLAASLIEKTGKEFSNRTGRGVIYLEVAENYLVGLVLSLKNNRTILNSMRNAAGKLLVDKFKFKDGQNGVEVGLFALNPLTGKGLVTSYWGGVGPAKLAMLFGESHNEIRRELGDRFIKVGLKNGEDRVELRKQVKKLWGQKLQLTVICNDDSFEEVLANFQHFSSLRVAVNPQLLDAKWFKPAVPESQSTAITVAFRKDTTFKAVRSAIRAMYDPQYRDQVKALSLVGIGLDGEEISRAIHNDRVGFATSTYDELLDKMTGGVFDDFHKWPAAKELLALMVENQSHLGRKPKNVNWLPRGPAEDISLVYE